jgi:hypothetical protein
MESRSYSVPDIRSTEPSSWPTPVLWSSARQAPGKSVADDSARQKRRGSGQQSGVRCDPGPKGVDSADP